MSDELKIGDTVWFFDVNHRVHEKDKGGRPSLVYREQWRPRDVIGETSRSWLVGHKYDPTKLPKSGKWPAGWARTTQQVEDDVWVCHHRYRIGNCVTSCYDAATLRKVAELIGYEAKES